jgi:subtilisin family serine protease
VWRALVPGILVALAGALAAGLLLAEGDGLGDRARRQAPEAGPALRTIIIAPKRIYAPPELREDPARVGRSADGAGAAQYTGELLVKFEEGTPAAAATRLLSSVEGEIEGTIGRVGVRVVDVPAGEAREAADALEGSPAVEFVERDVVVEMVDTVPNDSLWSTQWGAVTVKAPRSWDTTTGAPEVVVAVLDTGIDAGHPDLQGALVPGHDVVGSDGDPSDDNGHGTAAAGVIAARGDNGEGLAGICWSCSLMPVKVLDASGSGSTSKVAAGIVWAVDHGARVINMSLGGTGSTQTLADAVAYAAARGVVLVGAAGNNGSAERFYPAAYPEVIGVAAVTSSNGLYSWSNFGGWVQVAAPGCNTAPYPAGEYVNFCGTSSAAPVVSGLVGLARSFRPEAPKVDVEEAIRTAAVPLPEAVQYGIVDAEGMLRALGAQQASETPPAEIRRATFSGRVTRLSPRRRYALSVAGGKLVAELTFAATRSLTLLVVDESGTVIGRVSGGTPLRLGRTVRPGGYTVVVSRRKADARFTLAVRYPVPS